VPFVLAQTEEVVKSVTHTAEQAGITGAIIALLTICIIALWKYAMSPFLDKIVTISSQVRDVVGGTERTANILARAVDKIDPALWDSGKLPDPELANHGGKH